METAGIQFSFLATPVPRDSQPISGSSITAPASSTVHHLDGVANAPIEVVPNEVPSADATTSPLSPVLRTSPLRSPADDDGADNVVVLGSHPNIVRPIEEANNPSPTVYSDAHDDPASLTHSVSTHTDSDADARGNSDDGPDQGTGVTTPMDEVSIAPRTDVSGGAEDVVTHLTRLSAATVIDAIAGLVVLGSRPTTPVRPPVTPDIDQHRSSKRSRSSFMSHDVSDRSYPPPTNWVEPTPSASNVDDDTAYLGSSSGLTGDQLAPFLTDPAVKHQHTSWIRKLPDMEGVNATGPVKWNCVEVRRSPNHGNKLGVWNQVGHGATFVGTTDRTTRAVLTYGGYHFHDIRVLDDPNFDESYCCESGFWHEGWHILDAHPRLLAELGGRPHSWIGSLVNQANTRDEINCVITILDPEQIRKKQALKSLFVSPNNFVGVEITEPIGSGKQWLTDYNWDRDVQLKHKCGLWYYKTQVLEEPWDEELLPAIGTLVRDAAPGRNDDEPSAKKTKRAGAVKLSIPELTPDTVRRIKEDRERRRAADAATSSVPASVTLMDDLDEADDTTD